MAERLTAADSNNLRTVELELRAELSALSLSAEFARAVRANDARNLALTAATLTN